MYILHFCRLSETDFISYSRKMMFLYILHNLWSIYKFDICSGLCGSFYYAILLFQLSCGMIDFISLNVPIPLYYRKKVINTLNGMNVLSALGKLIIGMIWSPMQYVIIRSGIDVIIIGVRSMIKTEIFGPGNNSFEFENFLSFSNSFTDPNNYCKQTTLLLLCEVLLDGNCKNT